jgi:hypothetical protein
MVADELATANGRERTRIKNILDHLRLANSLGSQTGYEGSYLRISVSCLITYSSGRQRITELGTESAVARQHSFYVGADPGRHHRR